MAELKKGQHVQFFRTHDKSTPLTGKVVSIEGDLVHIQTDEAKGSVSRLETAHATDVTLIAKEEATEEKHDHTHGRKSA